MNIESLSDSQKQIVFKIAKTFVNFGLQAKIVTVINGPVVTGYGFNLLGSTQIANVSARRQDIALALGVDSVTIARAKDVLILYVPNVDRQIVDFKDYLHWYMHDELCIAAKLPLPLGIDPEGNKRFLELTDCPHVLISGQTGSGKSILESAFITCLVTKYSSDDLKLYLVDTKQVDLPLFTKLPHVVRCAKSASEYFKLMSQLYSISKQRLAHFNIESVRNIEEYKTKTSKQMSYIVLVIDELANLLDEDNAIRSGMDRREKAETPSVADELKSLAQICRAAGIHIVCGTQRSSVKIVNGDIKVNFPCRIALRLPSYTDSRTILDQGGAENLLGKGDMLVKQPGLDTLQRYHGPFVKLSDIEYIVSNLDTIREVI